MIMKLVFRPKNMRASCLELSASDRSGMIVDYLLDHGALRKGSRCIALGGKTISTPGRNYFNEIRSEMRA